MKYDNFQSNYKASHHEEAKEKLKIENNFLICVKLGYIFRKQCRDGVTKIDFASYPNNHFAKKKNERRMNVNGKNRRHSRRW